MGSRTRRPGSRPGSPASKNKKPRVRDSGDAPGASTPAGWAGIKDPALGRIAGAPFLGADGLVPGRLTKVPGPSIWALFSGPRPSWTLRPGRHAAARAAPRPPP